MASSVAVRRSIFSPHFPRLPALRDFVYMYRLNADKAFSQNYLMDMNLTRKMVRRAGDMTDAFVVEVGPGPGGITRAILEQPCRQLDVVEIDKQFLMPLQLANHSSDRMHIHRDDVLKTDIGQMWEDAGADKCPWVEEQPPFHIIGNLPFHIATPLIIKLMRQLSVRGGPFAFGRVPLTFTLQSEVAKRVVAAFDTEDRSRIGVTCQNLTEPRILFDVPGRSFTPRPDINVCVVQFLPRIAPLIPTSYVMVDKVFRALFHYKRRPLAKAIGLFYPKEMARQMTSDVLRRSGVNPKHMVTELSMENFADIALLYEEQCRQVPGLFFYEYQHPKRTLEMLVEEVEDPFPPKYLS